GPVAEGRPPGLDRARGPGPGPARVAGGDRRDPGHQRAGLVRVSVAARDPATGALGLVISSSSPAVAARCLHLRPLVGVAASQNVTNPALGPRLLDLLQGGAPAGEAMTQVVAEEAHPDSRQLTAVDAAGRGAQFSRARTLGTHAVAPGHQAVAAGNLLAGPQVVQAMIDAYQASPEATFDERLLARFCRG